MMYLHIWSKLFLEERGLSYLEIVNPLHIMIMKSIFKSGSMNCSWNLWSIGIDQWLVLKGTGRILFQFLIRVLVMKSGRAKE